MASAVDLKKTTIQLNEVSQGESQIWVAGVSLPVPKQIIGESQVNHLKASDSGLKEVDQARQRKGWTRVDLSWVKAAKTPASILQRFWQRWEIPRDNFVAICQAVGLDDWDVITREKHFSVLRTKISDGEVLKATLHDLGIAVKTEADVRGDNGQRIRVDIVAVLEGEYDIGWSRNSQGTFDMVADLWGVTRKHNLTELTNAIFQKYSINKTLKEAKHGRSNSFSSFSTDSLTQSISKKRKCPRTVFLPNNPCLFSVITSPLFLKSQVNVPHLAVNKYPIPTNIATTSNGLSQLATLNQTYKPANSKSVPLTHRHQGRCNNLRRVEVFTMTFMTHLVLSKDTVNSQLSRYCLVEEYL